MAKIEWGTNNHYQIEVLIWYWCADFSITSTHALLGPGSITSAQDPDPQWKHRCVERIQKLCCSCLLSLSLIVWIRLFNFIGKTSTQQRVKKRWLFGWWFGTCLHSVGKNYPNWHILRWFFSVTASTSFRKQGFAKLSIPTPQTKATSRWIGVWRLDLSRYSWGTRAMRIVIHHLQLV